MALLTHRVVRLAVVMGAAITLAAGGPADAAAVRTGLVGTDIPGNDDDSVGPISLGFTANFFGANYAETFVNNNGNITFTSALDVFTPFGLNSNTAIPIIAPFFADVDTENPASGVASYGGATIDGKTAFFVNWIGVGHFELRADKLNSFQLVLFDRSDTGAGNFDIEFNYDQIQWETGDLSGGVDGLGGDSARIGYSNGTGAAGSFFELAGSGVNGAFLDAGPLSTRLIANMLNSNVAGRYVFNVRSGVVTPEIPIPAAGVLMLTALAGAAAARRKSRS